MEKIAATRFSQRGVTIVEMLIAVALLAMLTFGATTFIARQAALQTAEAAHQHAADTMMTTRDFIKSLHENRLRGSQYGAACTGYSIWTCNAPTCTAWLSGTPVVELCRRRDAGLGTERPERFVYGTSCVAIPTGHKLFAKLTSTSHGLVDTLHNGQPSTFSPINNLLVGDPSCGAKYACPAGTVPMVTVASWADARVSAPVIAYAPKMNATLDQLKTSDVVGTGLCINTSGSTMESQLNFIAGFFAANKFIELAKWNMPLESNALLNARSFERVRD